jgi:hypothetical protein
MLRSDGWDLFVPSNRSLGFMDVDSTVQISSSATNLTVVVSPPPELSISSVLEYFVSVQRLQLLLLL